MKYLLSIILNVAVGQNVQSVKMAVGQMAVNNEFNRLGSIFGYLMYGVKIRIQGFQTG
jgi:hypothetical protein